MLVDKTFTHKTSGKDTLGPQLDALMAFVRETDIALDNSMDRLAAKINDLPHLLHTPTRRGAHIAFNKDQLAFTGADSPLANLMLSAMGAYAKFKRGLLHELDKGNKRKG